MAEFFERMISPKELQEIVSGRAKILLIAQNDRPQFY